MRTPWLATVATTSAIWIGVTPSRSCPIATLPTSIGARCDSRWPWL